MEGVEGEVDTTLHNILNMSVVSVFDHILTYGTFNNTQKIAFSNGSCEIVELSSVEKHQLCVSERRKEYIFKCICIIVHMALLALSRTLLSPV